MIPSELRSLKVDVNSVMLLVSSVQGFTVAVEKLEEMCLSVQHGNSLALRQMESAKSPFWIVLYLFLLLELLFAGLLTDTVRKDDDDSKCECLWQTLTTSHRKGFFAEITQLCILFRASDCF